MSRPGCSTSTTRSIPADCNLFAEIDQRMGEFIAERFGVSQDEAQRMRKTYYYEHGTTLAGLMRLHDVSPNAFLDYVHDIDLSVIAPAPELRRRARCAAGAQVRLHQRLAPPCRGGDRERLGVDGQFDDIFDIHAAEFIPSRSAAAYRALHRRTRRRAAAAAMFDDLPHNLAPRTRSA